MKLLINSDIVRSQAVEVIKDGDNTILKIKYFENQTLKEYVFEVPYNVMYRNQLIKGLNKITLNDKCRFVYTKNEEDKSVYAILHSEEIYPSDIFVPILQKEQIKIIKKFDYLTYTREYGTFTSTIYFAKLEIDDEKSIFISRGPKSSKKLNRYFEICKNGDTVLIRRKWKNNSGFVQCIPLSEL